MKLFYFISGCLISVFSSANWHTVESQSIADLLYFDAQVEAVNASTLSAQTQSSVKSINVEVNDVVEKGSLLIELDDIAQLAGVQKAIALLDQANANFTKMKIEQTRAQRLFEQGSLSQGLLDSANANAKSLQAAVNAAKAQLKQAEQQLSYTKIYAPFSGVVTERHIQMAETVSPGKPLISGLALSPLRAVVNVPQTQLKWIKKDNLVLLSDQQTQQQSDFLVSVESVTPFLFAHDQNHSVKVHLNLNAEAKLRPNSWLRLQVKGAKQSKIMIPQSATLIRNDIALVYVQQGEKVKTRQVRLGQISDGRVEILAGLVEGEVIQTDVTEYLSHQKGDLNE